MKLKIIEIPNSNSISNFHWCKFIAENRFREYYDVLKIDFSNCHFIKPLHIVSLACLVEDYFLVGSKIEFVPSSNPDVNSYLKDIKLFGYWTKGFDRTSYLQTDRATHFPLWQLRPSMLSSYVYYAQKYFEDNRHESIKGKSFEPLNIALAELFNNIIDHSNSKVSGYAMSQYYHKKNQLSIAVCDFGIGIPYKVNEYFSQNEMEILSEIDALKRAFQLKFSTKSAPHNKGFGLDNISRIVESCNGSLSVLSNNTVMVTGKHNSNFFGFRCKFSRNFIPLDTRYKIF